jgi:hypothetical protein
MRESGRTLSYASLVAGRRLNAQVDPNAKPKPPQARRRASEGGSTMR